MRLAAFVVLGSGAAFATWLFFVWPPPSWWRTHWPSETAFMHMRAQQHRAAGDTTSRHYSPVGLDSINDALERMVLIGEDDAFYQHHGIDWNQLRQVLGYRYASFSLRSSRDRAELWRVLSRGQDGLRGASTITQQLAKNLYLSPSRNPLRKLKEAVTTWRLERALEKERILELYLSVAELGENVWGVEAASQRYFNRGAARLSQDQSAMIAATLPHPRSSNPGHRPGRTRHRADLLLRRFRGPVDDPILPLLDSLLHLEPVDTFVPSLPIDTLDPVPLPPDTLPIDTLVHQP